MSTRITRENLSYSAQSIDESDILAVAEALKSSHLTQGEKVLEFERALCDYTGAKYALAMNSATSALYAAYVACGLKNACVITTPISFVATTNMLKAIGAHVIFCDVTASGNICAQSLERTLEIAKNQGLSPRAVVSVDMGGRSVEINEIRALCKRDNLIFISDSAHSLGGEYHGRKIGTLADCTIFSFHPLKPITTFEGGALLSDDFRIYNEAKLIRSHGVQNLGLFYDVVRLGFNFRLSDVACALGISQLKRLDEFITKREDIAKIYNDAFADNELLRPIVPSHKSSLHLYQILVDNRDALLQKLRNEGIFAQVHYRPIYEFSLYKDAMILDSYALDSKNELKGAKAFSSRVLALPCHQQMSKEDALFVIDAVRRNVI